MFDKHIDPYVEITIDGNKARTMRFDNTDFPVFNMEFWLPVLVPQGASAYRMAPGKRLKVTLYDWNLSTKREIIYAWNLDVTEILARCLNKKDKSERRFLEAPRLLWHNLYEKSAEAKRNGFDKYIVEPLKNALLTNPANLGEVRADAFRLWICV